jgi:hypothetical protein
MMYAQDYDETYACGWGSRDSGKSMWRATLRPYIQKYGLNESDMYGRSRLRQSGRLYVPQRRQEHPGLRTYCVRL